MTIFDEIAEKIGDDQWEKWKIQVLDAKDEIAAFVATYQLGATTAFYPIDKLATAPFRSAKEYFDYLMQEHMTHLWTQRNLAFNRKEADERYGARRLFAQLVDKFCVDCGRYKLFCDDFRPQNMLVNPKTLRITAVLDLEFTNALPG
ncbi:MAG: hypothetical protein Q9165_008931 [Trypethelium subeluteriae]